MSTMAWFRVGCGFAAAILFLAWMIFSPPYTDSKLYELIGSMWAASPILAAVVAAIIVGITGELAGKDRPNSLYHSVYQWVGEVWFGYFCGWGAIFLGILIVLLIMIVSTPFLQ